MSYLMTTKNAEHLIRKLRPSTRRIANLSPLLVVILFSLLQGLTTALAQYNQTPNKLPESSSPAPVPASATTGTTAAGAPTETLRAEVAKPLQAIQALMTEKKYNEALAKVREAELVPNKTPYEMFIIDQMRGAAAAGAGETALAVQSFESVLATGRLKSAASLPIIEAVAGTYFRSKNYPSAVIWARRFIVEGGVNAQMRLLLQQSLYLTGEYAEAAKEITADIKTTEAAGKTPTEDILKLLASCALKQKDNVAYVVALEKLVIYYPKKEYWADYIYRVESKPTFADRLSLNVYRLKLQLDLLDDAADYMRMALLATQAGFPIETKQVLEQGFTRGVLGTGNDAAAQKKLKDAASKEVGDDAKNSAKLEAEALAAKDGTALVGVGFNYVLSGQAEARDQGIMLMEQGIKKGGLKRPEEATLRLGMAYALAGQKQKAVDTLNGVQGPDGTADVAMLWRIYAGQVKK